MVEGAGIDIVEISQLKQAVIRWREKFINRIFTSRELHFSNKKRFPYEYLAARFAAKEAVLKAFGDFKGGVNLKDIEILNDEETGKPIVTLHNEANNIKNKRKISDVILSISHTRNYAVASALLVSKNE